MIKLGRNKQINCIKSDFYEFIGYLANHRTDAIIVFEKNSEQGAWGDELRIKFVSPFAESYFAEKGFKFTAGIAGSISARLNCNDLGTHLNRLGFFTENYNKSTIIKNIPAEHINSFNIGAQL